MINKWITMITKVLLCRYSYNILCKHLDFYRSIFSSRFTLTLIFIFDNLHFIYKNNRIELNNSFFTLFVEFSMKIPLDYVCYILYNSIFFPESFDNFNNFYRTKWTQTQELKLFYKQVDVIKFWLNFNTNCTLLLRRICFNFLYF